MVEVIWSPQAQRDLADLFSFIARDAPRQASLFIGEILDKTESLKRFPDIGRVVPEVGRTDIRELFHGRYRIVYRRRETAVDIVTVYHGARLLDADSLGT